MALRNYIICEDRSNADTDGFALDINMYVNRNGLYDVHNPKDIIADEIYTTLEIFIDEKYSKKSIRKLLDTDGKFRLKVDAEAGYADKAILIVNNEEMYYQYNVYGGSLYQRTYRIKQIDDEDLVYIVPEHIICPDDNHELILKCYHPFFNNYLDAVKYCQTQMKRYALPRGSAKSGYRVFPVSRSDTEESKWYNLNIRASEIIRKYRLSVDDYRYLTDLDKIEMHIKADSYDDLSEEEQADINRELCHMMYKYVDEERANELNTDDFDMIPDDDIESVADDVILFALLSAQSEEEFQQIHTDLGPYEYRVGALTDEIYNTHGGQGFVLMCSDGNMAWYSSCEFINDWEGAKDSPYYGKFQRLDADPLLCLREYHPELIVDVRPTAGELNKYKKAYMKALVETRRRHDEIYNDDSDDTPVCTGTWYKEGVESDKFQENARFQSRYNNYSFSIEQCKDLLSGDEITIDDYVSQIGITTSIRGKLKESSDFDYDGYDIRFGRTDIKAKARKMLTADMGISEPGLPEDEDE